MIYKLQVSGVKNEKVAMFFSFSVKICNFVARTAVFCDYD